MGHPPQQTLGVRSRQRNTVAPSAVAAEVATVPSEVVDLSAGSATDMEFHSLQLSVPMEARTATELRGPTVGAQALLSALPSARPSMMRNLPPLDTAWAAWRRWTLPDWATLAATLPPDLRQLQSPPATATAPPQPTRSVLLPRPPSTSTEPPPDQSSPTHLRHPRLLLPSTSMEPPLLRCSDLPLLLRSETTSSQPPQQWSPQATPTALPSQMSFQHLRPPLATATELQPPTCSPLRPHQLATATERRHRMCCRHRRQRSWPQTRGTELLLTFPSSRLRS